MKLLQISLKLGPITNVRVFWNDKALAISMIPSFFAYASAIWFVLIILNTLNYLRNLKFLRNVTFNPNTNWPRISLIAAACNEGDTISEAVTKLLQINYPNLQIILVNDRSTDRTGKIIDEFAAMNNRIKALHIKELPSGWLGKVHALHEAVQISDGDWLLFTDADIHMAPQCLKKAIHYCEHNNKDFLTVSPELMQKTFALTTMIVQFGSIISMGYNEKRLSDPSKPDAIGIGAFNLARKSIYNESVQHKGIRMDVIDDGALAWVMKKAGARLAFLNGTREISVEWYDNLPAFIRGLEKNLFALFQYSVIGVTLVCTIAWSVAIGTVVIPWFSEGVPFLVFLISFLSYLIVSGYSIWRALDISPFIALTLPFSFFLMPAICLRSSILCLMRRGISWRGTFYPLAELKDQQKLRLFDLLFRS